jgi:glycosyltransferase involved in cell wall biosynthesis
MLHSSNVQRREHFLLSVGWLTRSKGHDLVVRAAACTSKHRSVIIVSPRPDPPEERRLRNLAAELEVALEVRIGISDDALADLYRTAHAMLYLARREPLGLASLEAQACGCPVVVADEGGLPETITDGVTGFKTAREPRAVASAVELLDDSATHRRFSEQARQHTQSWSWKTSAEQIHALLDDTRHSRRVR